VRMGFDFPQHRPAPRQDIVSKQELQRLALLFCGMILQPGGGQQQRSEMIRRTFPVGIPCCSEKPELPLPRNPPPTRYGTAERCRLHRRTAHYSPSPGTAFHSFSADAPAAHPAPAASWRPVSLADQGKQRHQQRVLRLTVIQRTQHAAED
jgi:hypothetical protein